MSQISSGFLPPDDQDFLYENVDMSHVDLMFEDHTLFNGQEDIKNIELVHDILPTIPVGQQNILSKEKYVGPYDFQLVVDSGNNSNNGYLYSDSLNKVYIKLDFPLQLGFKLNVFPPKQLYIRITPVYSLSQHAQECVYRCINHAYKDTDIDEHIRQHIIRCNNPNAQYKGDQKQNERLSVVLPLSNPQTGSDRVNEMFQFVCQNSCPTPGMNRRPIELIITLEDETGICGRQTLNVRVCCSPKRDMLKDDKEFKEFNEVNHNKVGKKRKIEKADQKISTLTASDTIDTDEYKLDISILGKHNVQSVLKYCKDLMAGEMVKHKNKPEETTFKKYHDDFSYMLKKSVE